MAGSELYALGVELGAAGNRVSEGAGRVVRQVGGELRNLAIGAAPVDTGFHRGAIHGRPIGQTSFLVDAGAHYAVYLEWGTWKMAPQPILNNAPHTEMIEGRLEEALRQMGEQVMRG